MWQSYFTNGRNTEKRGFNKLLYAVNREFLNRDIMSVFSFEVVSATG